VSTIVPPLRVELRDAFWAPRQAQLRDHTLPVLLERLEAHGAVDNFRRITGRVDAEHRGMWFADSDVYKWMEAAAWAGRTDLLDPVIDDVVAAQQPDGYLHTFFGARVAGRDQPRWGDLGTGHEIYCLGHFIEAALAHEQCTGSPVLLDAARRVGDHLCATFGPDDGLDHRVDKHPEIELAMARLAGRTGDERYLAYARWAIESHLVAAGLSITTVDLAGHAVRALYLGSGIAEVALATGEAEWVEAAARLFDTMVTQRSYPTGGVGGRWLGEAVGQAYELPDAMAYAESCAAVAATQFSGRVWRLTHDLRALEQIETLLYNAVPCGVGEDGDSWFYSQPHAVGAEAVETNPWTEVFDYGPLMLLDWFPPHRHEWFDVCCCPPNLARMFATVDRGVAEVAGAGEWDGDLLVHLPVAARITGQGWDVEVSSPFPDGGAVTVRVRAAPQGRAVRVRRPMWAERPVAAIDGGGPFDGGGHVVLADGGSMELSCAPTWWETDPRVEGAAGTVFLRCGPVVQCVEGVDVPGIDLRLLTVDPTRPPDSAFALQVEPTVGRLHRPAATHPAAAHPASGPAAPDEAGAEALSVATTPYHAWANRGPTQMRLRFRRALGSSATSGVAPAPETPSGGFR